MNRDTLRTVLRHLFAFLSAVCAFFLVMLVILAATAMRDGYLHRKLDESGFYGMQYRSLVSRLEELAPASGVDESFFADAADESVHRADTAAYIDAARTGGDTSAMKKELRARASADFNEKLIKYADDAGYEITDDVKDALSHLSEICADYYVQNVGDTLLAQGFALLGGYVRRVGRVLLPVGLVLLLLTVFSVFMTAHLSGGDRARALSVSGLALALMLSVIPIAAYIAGFPRRVYVMSPALTAFAVEYAGGLLGVMLIAGLAFGGCSAVAAYFYRKR